MELYHQLFNIGTLTIYSELFLNTIHRINDIFQQLLIIFLAYFKKEKALSYRAKVYIINRI